MIVFSIDSDPILTELQSEMLCYPRQMYAMSGG